MKCLIKVIRETPINRNYKGIINFDIDCSSWSFMLDADADLVKNYEGETYIKFLVPNQMPYILKQEGSTFKICEGSKVVATGKILSRETRFERDLCSLINAHSIENGSNTPDFLLAEYLQGCLDLWNKSVNARDKWYGVSLKPAIFNYLGKNNFKFVPEWEEEENK